MVCTQYTTLPEQGLPKVVKRMTPTLRLFGVGGDVLNVQALSTSQNPVISDGNCYNEQCCVNG